MLSKREGFTLLELCIAIALMAVLWTMVIVPLHRSIRFRKDASSHVALHGNVASFARQLKIDLCNVIRDLKADEFSFSFVRFVPFGSGVACVVYHYGEGIITRSLLNKDGVQLEPDQIWDHVNQWKFSFRKEELFYQYWESKKLPKEVHAQANFFIDDGKEISFERIYPIWIGRVFE